MNSFCVVYLDVGHWGFQREEITKFLAQAIDGEVHYPEVLGQHLVLSVAANADWNQERASANDFVYFRYLIEIEMIDGGEWGLYLDDISVLLDRCRKAGMKAIPACDFEEQLENMLRGEPKDS